MNEKIYVWDEELNAQFDKLVMKVKKSQKQIIVPPSSAATPRLPNYD